LKAFIISTIRSVFTTCIILSLISHRNNGWFVHINIQTERYFLRFRSEDSPQNPVQEHLAQLFLIRYQHLIMITTDNKVTTIISFATQHNG
jgi:hypothetical protein